MPFYRNLYYLGAFQVALYAIYVGLTDYIIPFGKDFFAARSDVPVDFPVNFTKAFGDTAPKIVFNAFFADLDLMRETLTINWNVSPAEGECESGAPETVANIFYVKNSKIDNFGEDTYKVILNAINPWTSSTYQYISKDACTKSKDTIDFTTIGQMSRSSFEPRETMKSIFIREISHHAGTYIRVKYNGTEEDVPVAFTKARDLPQKSPGRLEAIVYSDWDESAGGITFDYHISRNSAAALCDWLMYWKDSMMLVVLLTLIDSLGTNIIINLKIFWTLPYPEAVERNVRILPWFFMIYFPASLLLLWLMNFTHCSY